MCLPTNTTVTTRWNGNAGTSSGGGTYSSGSAVTLTRVTGTYVFEELCREWVRYEADRGGLGFLPEQVGGFWTQRRGHAVQLDIVAAAVMGRLLRRKLRSSRSAMTITSSNTCRSFNGEASLSR